METESRDGISGSKNRIDPGPEVYWGSYATTLQSFKVVGFFVIAGTKK